ncbi:hypothetical protein Lal_00049875 [Lupinus albus]|nr:hypothetical protein Lal_00049875 [Lupinus albus]
MPMLSAYVHAPLMFYFLPRWKRNLSRSSMAASSVRIAIVGDIHDCWNLEEDSRALDFLKVPFLRWLIHYRG